MIEGILILFKSGEINAKVAVLSIKKFALDKRLEWAEN